MAGSEAPLPDRQLDFMLSTCAALNVRRAARIVTKRYDEALRPVGVRSTQLPLLVTTARNRMMTVTELAESVGMDRSTLTRNLAVLEEKGWIKVADGADRRTREVRLTARGNQIVRRAVPFWKRAQQEMADELGAGRLERVIEDLSGVLDTP